MVKKIKNDEGYTAFCGTFDLDGNYCKNSRFERKTQDLGKIKNTMCRKHVHQAGVRTKETSDLLFVYL